MRLHGPRAVRLEVEARRLCADECGPPLSLRCRPVAALQAPEVEAALLAAAPRRAEEPCQGRVRLQECMAGFGLQGRGTSDRARAVRAHQRVARHYGCRGGIPRCRCTLAVAGPESADATE